LNQYFASMRRIEELIQYRAQFKIDSNNRGAYDFGRNSQS